jgi:exodeoxyribonuclease VII small subunit
LVNNEVVFARPKPQNDGSSEAFDVLACRYLHLNQPDSGRTPAMAKTVRFEDDLQQLERCVNQLEDAELSLEEALKLYEAGVKCAERCRKALARAESRLELLDRQDDGQLICRPATDPDEELR